MRKLRATCILQTMTIILIIAVIAAVIAYFNLKNVVIMEYQRGVLFRRGTVRKVLDPGSHWTFHAILGDTVQVMDIREQSLVVSGQEVLTKDTVPVKTNTLVRYAISDPRAAVLATSDLHDRLYQEVQIVVRDLIQATALEALLADRAAMNAAMTDRVTTAMRVYGLAVADITIKDIVLGQDMRDAFAAALIATKHAAAALIGAREKVATTRALANAADLIKNNPIILRLKELDALRDAAHAGTTIVFRMGGANDDLGTSA